MRDAPSGGLQIIFSIFLGLMITAFVGVGVYTFYPPPDSPYDSRIRDLSRQQQALTNSKAPDSLTPADRERLQALTDQINEAQDRARDAREVWGRRSSIVLIAFATLVMGLSLAGADRLPVISNGLLLGGLFTMLYGVGWIVTSDTSMTRFFVITGALVITFGLGYVRFVRLGATAAAAPGAAGLDSAGMAEIDRRVRDLEARMTDAARALTSRASDAPSMSS
jgi:hypothetical protein